MTWNVENLFRPGGMAGVRDSALYKQKLRNLAETITAHRPDIIGLQEVGDPGALDDLKAKLGASYPHVLLATHFDAMHPIRVAALLRRGVRPTARDELIDFPAGALTNVPQARGQLTAMGRGALAFSAAIGGESIRFVVTHLKSKLLTYPGHRFQPRNEDERAREGGFALLRRAAEAVAIRVWANDWLQDHPGGPLVVLGDLNDGVDAATTQILYGPPDQNLNKPDKGDAWRLLNLARFLRSPDTAYSRVYRGRTELIDHILANTELARRNIDIAIDTTHVTSIGDQPPQRRRAVWPDHAPVVAVVT
jgi:predicted extracellular nuclease